jgi:hypothetical protein
MTLIKSVLLGSAASLLVVAGAQAADLPTKKGAPAAEYVKVCKIGGIAGFIIPGSDTCLKISGYVQAHATVGNSYSRTQDQFGMFVRGNVAFDAVSNTAYGPLLSHIDVNADHGYGYDSNSSGTVNLDNAYIQWAGITAGQHGSFFDFHGGIGAWDDLITPDHTGTGTPLFAYTATFGGGFSATLSAETPRSRTGLSPYGYTIQGERAPDVVAAVDLTQGWGAVHLAGVAHYVHGTNTAGTSNVDKWGYAGIAGVTFNIPGMAGGTRNGQVVYTKDASDYIGLNEVGVNLPSGIAWTGSMPDVDGFGQDVTGWSTAVWAVVPFSPNFKIQPEISYGYASVGGFNESAWIGGATFDYSPVTNLDFAIDILYEEGQANLAGPGLPTTSFSGYSGKLRVARSF